MADLRISTMIIKNRKGLLFKAETQFFAPLLPSALPAVTFHVVIERASDPILPGVTVFIAVRAVGFLANGHFARARRNGEHDLSARWREGLSIA